MSTNSTLAERSAKAARVARQRVRGAVQRLRDSRSPADDRPPVQQGDEGRAPTGVVEQFTRGQISGWVDVPKGAPATRVSLRLNGVEVTATWANDEQDSTQSKSEKRAAHGEVRTYYFRLRDIWAYARKGDRIGVRVNGKPMPIAGQGSFFRVQRSGQHTADDLRTKLEGGYVFSHTGALQLSRKDDAEWQRAVTDLYAKVRSVVSAEFGYDCFLMYGSLLGAVREGGVIGHDVDFDAAYVSRQDDPKEAAKELARISLALVDAGLDIDTMATALHIHDGSSRDARIDLFHLYFDTSGELCFPFGVAGTTVITREQWTGMREIEFAGAQVLIPEAAEAVVECIYGADWRKPKPGFRWSRDRTRLDRSGQLAAPLREAAYWSNFYARNGYQKGSTFSAYVLEKLEPGGLVIDLGCGDGRDALTFARSGFHVVGADQSPIGLRHATATAQEEAIEHARFVTCDVSDTTALRAVVQDALDGAPGQRATFYLRFFLHSVPEQVQEGLMKVLSEVARPGDQFAAEFRTEGDAELPKTHGNHYRRYQNGDLFASRLVDDFGFTILDQHEGTGLSPYGDEDPVLFRVFSRREG